MKKALSSLLILLLIACGSGTGSMAVPETADVPRTEQDVTITSGTPVTMADISIDGMTCEMACGGAIKKALRSLPGVAAADIEFVEGDVTDHAIVTYDAARVSDAEMVKAIQALHDGQYKVLAVSVTHQVLAAPSEGSPAPGSESEGDKVSASLPDVLVPSILELLSQVVRL